MEGCGEGRLPIGPREVNPDSEVQLATSDNVVKEGVLFKDLQKRSTKGQNVPTMSHQFISTSC